MSGTSEPIVWQNRRLSFIEGSFYAIMVAFGESLILPFSLHLGLKPTQIAILATLPVALGGFSQFLTPLLEPSCFRRKPFVSFLMGIQVLGLSFLGLMDNPGFLICLTASIFYWIGGAGCQPLWVSWMIPENPSNKISLYHARRNALIALISFVFFVGAGVFLYYHPVTTMFRFFFNAGALARAVSAILILFHLDPHTVPSPPKQEVLSAVVKRSWGKGFLISLLSVLVLFRAGSGLAAPHFTQYMLVNLHQSYLVYTILVGCAFLGRTILLESWIVTSHEFGSKNTLLVSCLVISFIPVLWLVSSHFAWLLGLELLVGGAWSGFELLTLMILAGLGLSDWSRYVGLLGMLGTIGALLAGWYGGYLLEQNYSMDFLFWLSTILRLSATVLLFWVLKIYAKEEFKPKKMIPLFFSTLSLRPSFSNINWLFWRKRG